MQKLGQATVSEVPPTLHFKASLREALMITVLMREKPMGDADSHGKSLAGPALGLTNTKGGEGPLCCMEPVAVVHPPNALRTAAGEFTQHDFGQVRVRFRNGSTRKVRFFAPRGQMPQYRQQLPYSVSFLSTYVNKAVSTTCFLSRSNNL